MADIQQMAPVMSDADREVARTLRREKVSRVVRYVVLIFVGLLMLYPLAWMFSASFKPNHEIFTTLGLWPAHATWDGFINGWKTGTEYHFGHYMLNTFKYVIPKVVLTIISSTIVAYGFARFEIPWKKFWFATLITTMLLPSTVLLIPQYLMFREMGMLNSYLPLYLPLAFATQGFFVFMLIQFLRGVPRDMEEAAQIDGCNSIHIGNRNCTVKLACRTRICLPFHLCPCKVRQHKGCQHAQKHNDFSWFQTYRHVENSSMINKTSTRFA